MTVFRHINTNKAGLSRDPREVQRIEKHRNRPLFEFPVVVDLREITKFGNSVIRCIQQILLVQTPSNDGMSPCQYKYIRAL